MRTGLLVGLGAVAVVAVAGAIWVSTGPSGPASQERLFPALAGRINDATTVVVARHEDTTTIRLRDGAWTVAEKSDYPAAADKVRRVLLELGDLRTIEPRTSTPSLFPSLEVEDIKQDGAKSQLVTLRNSSGSDLAALIVGKLQAGRGGPAGDGTYVRKAGENQSWLARGRISLEKGTIAWLDRPLLNVARERVARVTVVQPDGTRLVVERKKAIDKDFSIVGSTVPKGFKIKSEWDVNQVGSPLETLELEDVAPAAQVPLPERRGWAEYQTFDGLTVRADIVDKESDLWVRFTAGFAAPATTPTEAETRDGKLKAPDDVKKEAETFVAKTSGWAYKLQDWKLDSMRKRFDGLIEEEKPEEKKP